MNVHPRAARIKKWVNDAPAWQTSLLVFVVVLAAYLLTMDRANFEQGVDAVAAALPSWRYSQFGDINLSEFADLPWVVDVDSRLVSNRAPGISFISVPMYWLFGSSTYAGAIPSMLPATATAALMSAGAVVFVHAALRRVTTPLVATGAALVFGLGTSTWSISANELWSHGPAQFFLAVAVLLLALSRYLAAGVAYGAALLIRPVTAIIAGFTGLILAWKRRSLRPAVLIGLGSLAGLAVLLVYNRAVLETVSVAPASYGESFLDRARTQNPFAYLGDVVGMILHPKYSLFLFSPFLVFTLPGLRQGWRRAEPWVRASALAGLAYILIHLRLNRYWGGAEFNYRYPLEMLVVMAPLLLLSWEAWFEDASDRARRLFWYSIPVSITVQIVAIWVEFTNPTV